MSGGDSQENLWRVQQAICLLFVLYKSSQFQKSKRCIDNVVFNAEVIPVYWDLKKQTFFYCETTMGRFLQYKTRSLHCVLLAEPTINVLVILLQLNWKFGRSARYIWDRGKRLEMAKVFYCMSVNYCSLEPCLRPTGLS